MRRRRIGVARRGRRDPFLARPDDIAFVQDLYVIEGLQRGHPQGPNRDLDRVWRGYEGNLNAALDALIARAPIPSDAWLRVLVPFVVGLLCRHPEFAERITLDGGVVRSADPVELDPFSGPDLVNAARWVEVNFVLAPVMAARWTVCHGPPDAACITNDLGFCGYMEAEGRSLGIAIPLGGGATLCLGPRKQRTILVRRDDRWMAPMQHIDVGRDAVQRLGLRVAASAPELIVGPEKRVVVSFMRAMHDEVAPVPAYAELADLSRATMHRNHMAWPCLVSTLAQSEIPDGAMTGVDWDICMLGGWHPPPLIGDTFYAPTSLEKIGGTIRLHLNQAVD